MYAHQQTKKRKRRKKNFIIY